MNEAKAHIAEADKRLAMLNASGDTLMLLASIRQELAIAMALIPDENDGKKGEKKNG